MRYGCCTWIFGEMPMEELAPRLSGLGCDGVEVFGDLSRSPTELRRLLDSCGLSVLSITPEGVDLAHPEAGLRSEALDYYLRLLDFAAELGSPMIACHGAVGRIRALGTQEGEERLLLEGVARLAGRAEEMGLAVAMEALNRYESHLLNTAAQAVAFVEELGSPAVGVLLDAYHMNIEEADPGTALWSTGDRLMAFHAADSNRRAAGRGHLPFPSMVRALVQQGFTGPVVVECTAPGPDPFTPVKGQGWQEQVLSEVGESIAWLRRLEEVARGEG